MRILLPVLLAAALSGCNCSPGSTPDGGGNPPGSNYAGALPPAEVLAALPKDDEGHPVLFASNATFEPGWQLGFVYDANRDGPLVRYGQCLGVVTSCLRKTGGPLETCADAAPACADDSGGAGCCAPACISQWQTLRAGGASADDAFDQSFLLGDCLQGFAALRPTLEVQP
jgi:hypothetical protein